MAPPFHDEAQIWVARVKAVFARLRAATAPVAPWRPRTPLTTDDPTLLLAKRLHLELRALGEQCVQDQEHPCRALAWRLWYFQHDLLPCVRDSQAPPDNNAAERAIRPSSSHAKSVVGRARRSASKPRCASPPSPPPGWHRATPHWMSFAAYSRLSNPKSEHLPFMLLLTLTLRQSCIL